MSVIDKLTIRKSYVNYYKRFWQLSKKPVAKISGLISLTIFTIAFFGVFAILPTFKTIAKLNRQIDDAEIINGKLAKKILSLQKAEQILTEMSNDLQQVNQVLPKKAEFERLAWQVVWLAKEKQVTITNESFGEFNLFGQLPEKIKIKDKKAKNDNKEILLEVAITGKYSQVKDFLESLAKMDRLVTIDEVIITTKKLKSKAGLVSASIKLRAYYLGEN